MNMKRKEDLIKSAYKRASGRSTNPSEDYKAGGINNVSLDGSRAGTASVDRQTSIESAQDERQAKNRAARKIVKAKEALAAKAKAKSRTITTPSGGDNDKPGAKVPEMGNGNSYDREKRRK